MTEQEAREILGLKPKETLDSAELKIATIRRTLSDQILARQPGEERDAKLARLDQVERAVEVLGGLSLQAETITEQSAFEEEKASAENKKKSLPLPIIGGAVAAVIIIILLTTLGGEPAKRELTPEEVAKIESSLSARQWPEVETLLQNLQSDNVLEPALADFRAGLVDGKEAEKRQRLAFLDGEVRVAVNQYEWEKARERLAEIATLEPTYASQDELSNLIVDGQKREAITALKQRSVTALSVKEWEKADSILKELQVLSPDEPGLADLVLQVISGRQKERADRQRSAKLTTYARSLDKGEFSSEALVALREALALHPENTAAAALLEKMASYARVLRVPEEFPTISAALAEARARDEVVVGEGNFEESFFIAPGVRLRGAGYDKTIIQCTGTESSVATIGTGTEVVLLSDLCLQHLGYDYADERYPVLSVQGGQVSLTSVKILNGAGHGAVVQNGGRLSANNCRFSHHSWSGVSVSGAGSQVALVNSRLSENMHNGLLVADQAQSRVSDCQIDHNTRSGVTVHSAASNVLQSSRLTENRDAGVTVSESAAATISNCRANANGFAGVLVHANAKVKLSSTQTNRNSQTGILLAKGASLLTDTGNVAKQNAQSARLENVDFGN